MRHIRKIIASCLLVAVAVVVATALARPVLAPRARDVQPIRTMSESHWRVVPAPKHHSTRRRRPRPKVASGSSIDPVLLGDQSVESSVDSTAARSPEAFSFVDQIGGTPTSISVYVDRQNQATTLIAGLYSDSGGRPASLLAAGSVASPRAGAWNMVGLANARTVSAGTRYWVAVLGKKGRLYFRVGSGTDCSSATSGNSYVSSLPSSWRRPHLGSDCPISAYVDGTAVGPTVVPPVNTAPPIISGTPVQGSTLTTSGGSWLPAPSAYAYQWQDCDASGSNCTPISGAIAATYTLTANDVAHTVRSVVTGSNSSGSTAAASGPTAVVIAAVTAPTNTAVPAISGTATQGQTLSTTNGTWSGSPTFSYQWQDCTSSGCTDIQGATGQTYTLQASDVGDQITVIVTGSNSAGSAKATANPVGPIGASPPPTASFTYSPSSPATRLPVIFDGSASTCAVMPCSYAWQDEPPSGSVYPLGSGRTMSFTFQNVGTKYVHLTVTDAQGRTADVEHDVTVGSPPPPAATAPSNTAKPTISGTAQQGSQLTATNGTWTGTAPISYAYQWQNCNPSCSDISGATASAYTPVAGDVGDTLDVVVTASNSAGSASATSVQTPAVGSAPPPSAPSNTAKPTITGTAQQGSQLTMDKGAWTGTAPMSFAYQWQSCHPSCSNIAGATASTYTPVTGDVGDTLDVVVTASNSAGSASATSDQTTAVTGAPPQPPPGTCDLNATPSTFTSQVAAATSGQTICLASGNYGTWKGGTSKALTITAQPGASPNFCFDLYNTTNLTINGGHTNYDYTTPGINATCVNAIEATSNHITIENVAIGDCQTDGGACLTDMGNGPVTLTGNIFHDYPTCVTNCGPLTQAAVHLYPSDTNRADLQVTSNLFENIAADGIDVGNEATIKGNDFLNLYSDPADVRHTDAIQWNGGIGSSDNNVTFEGNYITNRCTQGISAFDGTTNNVVEDNVVVGCIAHSLAMYGDRPGSLVDHNTVVGSGNAEIECPSKAGYPSSTTAIRDNIAEDGLNGSGTVTCTPSQDANNMSWPSFGPLHSSSDFIGSPQFVGGANPTTYAGYALAAGSPGKGQASDGGDVGARVQLYPRPPGLP